ncbi:MAG TPA: urease subunit alpha [Planctomycetota bacterium]|nr:urease subunit alpha [Planctomycetota bacterium]
MSHRITRGDYIGFYGPTAGDKLRLGDTALLAEVERDCTVHGDENVYSGAHSLRDTMGLSAGAADALDCAILNVVVLDWTGIYKADIGIKNGRIAGIGKTGNPDIMDGVTPGLLIGASTRVISGEGLIATAGAVDANVSLLSARQAEAALAAGITTLLGGGSGHASDFEPEACAAGAQHIEALMRATDSLPLNFGFYARAGTPNPESLVEQILGGAAGLSLHEFWGAATAALECALAASVQFDVPLVLRPDVTNESGGLDAILKALKNRPVCHQLGLGVGGGALIDALRVCGEERVIPFSLGSARPGAINLLDEHREALYARRRLDRNANDDIAFVEAAVNGGSIAAEDMLHDMGAIPVVCSGGLAAGRPADLIARTWQTAHKMSQQRGSLSGDHGANDNIRIRRYIAKYTINPALACGIAHEVGSLEGGKLADVVLWKPAFFGVKPECVIKGGVAVWGQIGAPDAALPLVEPVASRRSIFAEGTAAADTSLVFVSKHSLRQTALVDYHLRKKIAPVRGWRSLTKKEMRLNDACPKITIDLKKNTVTADGVVLTCEPSESLPLAQRYALF